MPLQNWAAIAAVGAAGSVLVSKYTTYLKGDQGVKGDKGDKGDTGAAGKDAVGLPGKDGAPGADGKDGANGTNGLSAPQIYNGITVPGGTLGLDGDFFLRTDTSDIYKKAAGTWSLLMNGVPALITGARSFDGTVAIAGATTLSSTLNVTGLFTPSTTFQPSVAGGASRAIAASDMGKVILVDTAAAARAYTLPAVATSAGYRVQFVYSVKGNTMAITAPAGTMNGIVFNYHATSVTSVVKTAATTVTFLATNEAGAYLNCYCDGTLWYVNGMSTVAAGAS